MYLSDEQLAARFSVSRGTVWRWHRSDPSFPRPVKLSPGCTRWKLADVERWVPGLGGFSDDLLRTSGDAASAMAEFDGKAQAAARAASALRGEAATLATQGFDKAREAADRLAEIVRDETDATSEATTGAEKLKSALEEMGDGSGGGAAGKAAKGLSGADKALKDFERSSDRTADSFSRMARSVLFDGANISDMLKRLGGNLFESGLSGLFKASGIGDIFAGLFDNGGMIPAGQFGIAGERGPEIVTGPARVTSRVDTARLMQGGGGRIEVVARVENGSIVQDVRRISGEIAVQVVREASPDIVRRSVGATYDQAREVPIGRRR